MLKLENFQNIDVTLSVKFIITNWKVVFDIICYADKDSAAKSKLASNLTIIQNDSQLQSPTIMETQSETTPWLS